MSLAYSNASVFNKFTSFFKPKDPIKREIIQSASIIERMIKNLEFSKRNLENILEDHKRRVKSNTEDPEMKKILEDEIRNIGGYLSIISKTLYDLAKIKYRLETLMYVEEPLKVLPEIIEEVRTIEPLIEKINPELLNHVKTLEQKVASILAISSSYIPGITKSVETIEKPQEQVEKETKQRSLPYVQQILVAKTDKKTTEQSAHKTTPGKASSTSPGGKEEHLNLMKEETVKLPEPVPASKANVQVSKEQSQALISTNIPLHIVEQWILEELRVNSGILDIKAFERKYGVSREVIMKALASLESKNQIRIKRKT